MLVNICEHCPFLIIRCIGVQKKEIANFLVLKLILPPLQFDYCNQRIISFGMENHLSYPDVHCVLYQNEICFRPSHSKSQFLVLISFCRFSINVIFMFAGDRRISLKKVTLAEYRLVMSTFHGQEYDLR